MIRLFSCSVYTPDGEERELRCPKCGCADLLHTNEADGYTDMPDYLGKTAICCECEHKFIITENCWETVCECD